MEWCLVKGQGLYLYLHLCMGTKNRLSHKWKNMD